MQPFPSLLFLTCTAQDNMACQKERGMRIHSIGAAGTQPERNALQVQRLQRVQAGSAELLAQKDAELRRRRREALIAEQQHGARAKAADGMRAAVAAAASGRHTVC
jgi:ribulose kinase